MRALKMHEFLKIPKKEFEKMILEIVREVNESQRIMMRKKLPDGIVIGVDLAAKKSFWEKFLSLITNKGTINSDKTVVCVAKREKDGKIKVVDLKTFQSKTK